MYVSNHQHSLLRRRPSSSARLSLALLLAVVVCAPALFALGPPQSNGSPPADPPPAVDQNGAAFAIQSAIETVGRDAGPSVVNITSTIVSQGFFSQPVPQQAVGSGFIYDNEGHIVTNYHVIANAQQVVVTLRSGKSYRGTVIGSDPSTDLAVVQIKADNLPPPLKLGNSDDVQVGQFVVALGNPFGLSHTLTFGVISAKGRTIQSPNGQFIGQALQTDAPINPGNSGGPLITLNQEVVGVNSQIISPSNSSAGIGFAVPANLVKEIVPQLIRTGHAEHPYLGVSGTGLSPALVSFLKQVGISVPVDTGFLVAQVAPGSPAERAGVQGATQIVRVFGGDIPIGGDIIVAINGQRITSNEDLSAYIESQTKVGQSVTLTLYQNGRERRVDVRLSAEPGN